MRSKIFNLKNNKNRGNVQNVALQKNSLLKKISQNNFEKPLHIKIEKSNFSLI